MKFAGAKIRSLTGGQIDDTLYGKLSRPDGTFHPAGEKAEVVAGQYAFTGVEAVGGILYLLDDMVHPADSN